MDRDAPGRVVSLDLIRGVAVLGILAINIAGFAGPPGGIVDPHYPPPGSFADEMAFAAKFLFFEGKMRALFTILFGASMLLFIDRAEAQGRSGEVLQLRRLGWLLLLGLFHFYLIWWGDILFLYGVAGILALFLRELSVRTLSIVALAIFTIWHLVGAAMVLPAVSAELRVIEGAASAAQMADYRHYLTAVHAYAQDQLAIVSGGYPRLVAAKLFEETFQPLKLILTSLGETLPLMLMGMVLYRTGFFAAGWTRHRMMQVAAGGTLIGLLLSCAILGWSWVHDFPVRAMDAAFLYWTAIPHLLMAAGYAAMLALAAPRLAATAPGARLVAAGRMAFSNYIGTSIVMTGIFYGWGLGLAGQFGHAGQCAFVLLGWALILAWSQPWLRRFRRGPLEWIWRSLTEKQLLANSR